MNVRGMGILEDFWRVHRDAAGPLNAWWNVVAAADWKSFVNCRATFASADQVKIAQAVVTLFNIKGNHYRLVAAVNYSLGLVVVRHVMTHKEYSEDRWKERL